MKNSNPCGEEDPHVGLINIGLTNVQKTFQFTSFEWGK